MVTSGSFGTAALPKSHPGFLHTFEGNLFMCSAGFDAFAMTAALNCARDAHCLWLVRQLPKDICSGLVLLDTLVHKLDRDGSSFLMHEMAFVFKKQLRPANSKVVDFIQGLRRTFLRCAGSCKLTHNGIVLESLFEIFIFLQLPH